MTGFALVMIAALGAPTLTLEEALRTAESNQPQLRQARATIEAAEARADSSMASLLPQVSASASYSRATNNFAPSPGSVPKNIGSSDKSSFDTTDYWRFGLNASQVIYDFGQSTGRWRASQATADVQRANAEVTRRAIFLTTRTTFFQARAQKELVIVAEHTVDNQQRHLDQIQAFVEAGTRPEIDLVQAKVGVANARLQLVQAQNSYATAKAQLNLAMGVVRATNYDVADDSIPAVPGEEGPLDPLVSEAMKRPDVLALQQQIRAQEASIRATRGAYGPTLSASTGLTEAGADLGAMAWNWNGAIQLNWPIFQGNATRAQVREGEATLSSLRAQLEYRKQQIALEIEQARIAIRAARESMSYADVAVENTAQRLLLAEGRYQAGAGNSLELADAQLAHTNAAAQKVQSQFTLSSARAQLLQALGRK